MDVPEHARVSLVFTERAPIAVAQGTILAYRGTSCEVQLDGDTGTPVANEGVILDSVNPEHALIQGHVESVIADRVQIQIERFKPRDHREFPRVMTGLDLQYRVLPPTSAPTADKIRAWAEEGVASPDASAWHRPNPFMDLSVSGLGFEDDDPPKEGDALLLSFSLDKDGERWRAGARVVRVKPGEGGAHRVAIELIAVPQDARNALMERTIEVLQLPGEASD